jgi:hypothetical protein
MAAKRQSCIAFISVFFATALTLACGREPEDDSLGNEEAALKDPATGKPTCAAPKVLVCHIPPGNPANAHEICVGEPAVAAHVKNHGDSTGACAPPVPEPPSTDAGTPPPADGGELTPIQ